MMTRKTWFLTLLLVAGAAYLLGQTGGWLCEPTALIQLHGVWHVASALAFGVFAETAFHPGSHVEDRVA